MQYAISGELAQVANLELDKSETCWASKGSIVALDPGLGWILKVPGGAGGAARRMMSGEGIALTFLSASANGQRATLAANQPGKIIAWNLDDGPVITTRGSFVAAFGPRVDIDVRVAKRAGAAFFGGAGLFLQRISGSGTVLVHGSGDFIERDLGEEGLKRSVVVAATSNQPPLIRLNAALVAMRTCLVGLHQDVNNLYASVGRQEDRLARIERRVEISEIV